MQKMESGTVIPVVMPFSWTAYFIMMMMGFGMLAPWNILLNSYGCAYALLLVPDVDFRRLASSTYDLRNTRASYSRFCV